MATLGAYVSREVLLACCVSGIVVTTVTTVFRGYIRIAKQHRLREDDWALLVATVLYVALAALYIVDIPNMYGVMQWMSDGFKEDKGLADFKQMMTLNWAVTLFFWAVLWSVKISLLLTFRRVILRTWWMRVWYCIFAFVIATFIGCVVSQLLSCDTLRDFTHYGACESWDNVRAQIASLYYSFAADVLTDLLIMAVPLRIIATLRLPLRDKWILACLFGVTSIAIAVSIIRVFLIWAKTGNNTPSPTWLALWAIIEGMVAIVVGCIPATAQIFRSTKETSSSSRPIGSGNTSCPSSGSEGIHKGSTFAMTTVEYAGSSVPAILYSPPELEHGAGHIRSTTEISVVRTMGPATVFENHHGLAH